MQFLPYLEGHVAFYGGDYKTPLEELLKANQNDSFVVYLIGQTYEKLGDRDKAMDLSHGQPNMGMGVRFTDVALDQHEILDKWLAELVRE